MSFIKKIWNKILGSYNSKTGFYFIRILILAIYVVLCFVLIKIIWDSSVKLLLIVLLIPSLLVLNGIMEALFLPSFRIERDMEELPSRIWWEKILVQYNLPKDITPSEVGIMMSWKAEMTNLICIIYKWINEWIVKVVTENGVKYIESIDDLWEKVWVYERNLWLNGWIVKIVKEDGVRYVKAVDDDLWKKLPEYEYYLFYKLFNGAWRRVKFNKLKNFKLKVNDMIVKSCVQKWYLSVKWGEIPNSEGVTYINNTSIWCAVLTCFLSCFVFLILNSWLWWFISFVLMAWMLLLAKGHALYFVKYTNKWEKLLANIYWYKYYLEHCEEEQINSDLEEWESYNKHLPYAIALKLNWKIIKELS